MLIWVQSLVMVAAFAPQTSHFAPTLKFRENRTLQWLCGGTVAAMAISGFHPEMVVDWCLENLLVFVLLAYLIATYKKYPLSNTSYALIFVFLCFHEWGAHFKYADVPLGEWMKGWLHTSRNHYDRVVHLSFGLFFGYPLHEMYARYAGVRGKWAYFFPVETVMAFGAIYECIEALVASIVSPDAGEAFVGMQGDMWDSQEDMAMGLLGGVMVMTALAIYRKAHKA
jgi:putative membrane protein